MGVLSPHDDTTAKSSTLLSLRRVTILMSPFIAFSFSAGILRNGSEPCRAIDELLVVGCDYLRGMLKENT